MAPDRKNETIERKDEVQLEVRRETNGGAHGRGHGDSQAAGSQAAMASRPTLLHKLEASLGRSHRALVALDLEAIERGTVDQMVLCRTLAMEMRRTTGAGGGHAMENPKLSEEVRNRVWKVLRAARLQAALLRRAQRKHHVMANMLAGSERNYAAPVARQNGSRFALPAENRD